MPDLIKDDEIIPLKDYSINDLIFYTKMRIEKEAQKYELTRKHSIVKTKLDEAYLWWNSEL